MLTQPWYKQSDGQTADNWGITFILQTSEIYEGMSVTNCPLGMIETDLLIVFSDTIIL